MTPKERAKAIPATRLTLHDIWIDEIAKAIQAAIEEEREECAKIVDEAYHALPTAMYSFAGGLLLDAAKEIRAREEVATEEPESCMMGGHASDCQCRTGQPSKWNRFGCIR